MLSLWVSSWQGCRQAPEQLPFLKCPCNTLCTSGWLPRQISTAPPGLEYQEALNNVNSVTKKPFLAGVRSGVRLDEPVGLMKAGLRVELPGAARPGVPPAPSAAAIPFLVLPASVFWAASGPAGLTYEDVRAGCGMDASCSHRF